MGIKGILCGVWCQARSVCFSFQGGWVGSFLDTRYESERNPSCWPSPGRTKDLSVWGLFVRDVLVLSFPLLLCSLFGVQLTGQRESVWWFFSYLLCYYLTNIYLVFPLLLRYHKPFRTRNVFIYMAWWMFPVFGQGAGLKKAAAWRYFWK